MIPNRKQADPPSQIEVVDVEDNYSRQLNQAQ